MQSRRSVALWTASCRNGRAERGREQSVARQRRHLPLEPARGKPPALALGAEGAQQRRGAADLRLDAGHFRLDRFRLANQDGVLFLVACDVAFELVDAGDLLGVRGAQAVGLARELLDLWRVPR